MIPNRFEDRTDGHRYQTEGVESLQDLEYAGILHEQGLGKTKIGLGVALHWLRSGAVTNVLVITKKNIIETWREEVAKHTWLEGYVIGTNPTQTSNALTGRGKVFIVNYDQARILADTIETWQRARRVGAILDESQAIKNPAAKTSEALMRLREGFVRRLIMTGTISANRPFDLWNQIRFLDGGRALDMEYDEAKKRYDLPRNEEEAESFAERMEELHARITGFTIRETKETAGVELPPKSIETWEAVLENRQRVLYDEYEQAAQVLIEKGWWTDPRRQQSGPEDTRAPWSSAQRIRWGLTKGMTRSQGRTKCWTRESCRSAVKRTKGDHLDKLPRQRSSGSPRV